MPSIVILTGNPLSRNPRVMKEACTLSAAGFDVEVLGASLNHALFLQDMEVAAEGKFRYTPVISLAPDAPIGAFFLRAERWAGKRALQQFGVEVPSALGYGHRRLLRAALARDADLFISHSEIGLWVASQLANAGRRIGVDMEDWFSEDLPPEPRRGKPLELLRALEANVLTRAVHSTSPSQVMSYTLARRFGCAPPRVIYNAFPWSDRNELDGELKDRKDRSRPSLHWYSQTLDVGRGLEDLFDALPHLRCPIEIHLRGKTRPEFRDHLLTRLPVEWRGRIHFHPLVSNRELPSRISEHDIGFAGEMKYCKSRDLTVTNKILHYLVSGLAVVASDTRGQIEVARKSGAAVRIYSSGNPIALAAELNALVSSPDELRCARATAIRTAKREFSWERQAPKLLQSIREGLQMKPTIMPS